MFKWMKIGGQSEGAPAPGRPSTTSKTASPKAKPAVGAKPAGPRPAGMPQQAVRPRNVPSPKEALSGSIERSRPTPARRPSDEDEDDTPMQAPGALRPQAVPAPRRPDPQAPTQSRREPTAEELAAIEDYAGKVLTAEGGAVAISPQQRQVIAALENGTLLIAKSSEMSSMVSSVRLLLQRSSVKSSQIYLVDLETIRKVYEAEARRNGSSEGNRDTAQMQRAVIELVRSAANMRCSDIHITVKRHEALIRIRSDGVMMKLRDLPAATAMDLCQAAFNMADASDAQYKMFDYQGARISSLKTSLPEGVQSVRLQFNPLPDNGRYLVMRLLYAQKVSGPTDVDQLGYSRHQITQIKRMRDKPFGIVIISGPTGSGKSTTLQTALQATAQAKNFEVNIITVEDPPEYEIHGAAQLPVVNVKTEEERREAFRSAITASLRSDPDIVMIGEIRDEASASLAFQAAMTGHQVWASLHANDALSILDRLRDQKVENYKVSDPSLVAGLIGQRLVRKLCDHCKLPMEAGVERGIISAETAELCRTLLGAEHADEHVHVANPDGCEKCKRRGYSGRTVVAETILPDRVFMELVASHKKQDAYEYWLKELDGMTMLEHAILKMAAGQVDPREVGDKVGILDEADPTRLAHLMIYDAVALPNGRVFAPLVAASANEK